MKAYHYTHACQTILQSKKFISIFNQTSTHKYASLSPSSYLGLSYNNNSDIKKLFHKDWLSPNEVTKIFTTLKPNLVLPMFDHISNRKDYKPNESLFNVIITKLGESKNCDSIDYILNLIETQKSFHLSDEFFYNVIKIYGNVGGLNNKAIKTLFDMHNYGVSPSTKTFNFVLNLLVNSNEFSAAHKLLLGVDELKVVIDGCTLNILIKGLCKSGKLDDALKVFDEMPKQGCKRNKQTFSTIMHCMCEKGMVDEAIGLLERMQNDGVLPDAVTFNVLVGGFQKQGRVDEAMGLLDRMRLMGCEPNKGTYQEVLYGLLKCKKYVDAKNFVHFMRSKALIPSYLSYKLLVLGLCQENLVGDVDWVLKSMVSVGFVPRMQMWRNVVYKVISRDDANYIASFSAIVED